MSHPPTPEQAAILDAITIANGSVMVEAGAGCAKTTTLELSSSRVRVPALALAFNKRIAVEMGNRLPGNFTCKTMNSLGHAAWARALNKNLKLDDRKSGKLITEIAKARRMDLTSDQWDAARGLFREAQTQGLVPDNSDVTLVEDTPEGWESLLDSHSAPEIDADDYEFIWEIAREALVYNIRLARDGVVSFDDQIYCSTLLGGQFGKFPVVFLDEDQDLNPLQIRMVHQSMRHDARLLAVGDRHQSIYAFRGAVGEAAEQIRTLRCDWTDLPLMTSFRVPQLVAIRQRAHVPLFTAHSANPTGKVITLGMSSLSEGWTWQDITDHIPDPASPIAVLCRNNAPLIDLAFKLIRQNVGCFVLGRDISRGIVALSKKIAPDDSTPADTIIGRLEEWRVSETSKAEVNNKPDQIERIDDRVDSLLAVLQSAECRDAGQLRRQIERLFSRDSGLVTLSTIHKAKGLEWPTVIHLDPWRIPSKYAKSPRAIEQEANLRYVCETRTKHTLIFANLDQFH